MSQGNLFDRDESQRRKEDGMELGASNRESQLSLARRVARMQCVINGKTNADEVGRHLHEIYGIDSLGPAAGSIFKGKEFEFTGEFVQSERKTNHGRLLRVWKLREGYRRECDDGVAMAEVE